LYNNARFRLIVALTAIFVVLCCHYTTPAQETGQIQTDTEYSVTGLSDHRPWLLVVPVWIPGYRGQFSIGGVEIGGGEDEDNEIFDQIFSSEGSISFYFMGEFSYFWKRWRFRADIFSADIGTAVNFKTDDGTLVEARIQPIMPSGVAAYRLKWWQRNTRMVPTIELWGYGGLRYYGVNLEVSAPPIDFAWDNYIDWLDPIIGLRVPYFPHRRWKLEAYGDIGGFGIGSQFAWTFNVRIVYQISPLVSARLGWSSMDVDYRGSFGSDEIKFDVRLAGPSAGIGFSF
jgi:hypothetical protein